MRETDCRKWLPEIVECARTGDGPCTGLQNHLSECTRCKARFDDELRVTSELRALADTAHLRVLSEARRNGILREFDLVQRRPAFRPALKWLTAAAAVVALAAIGSLEMRGPGEAARAPQTAAQEGFEIEGLPADSSGFVAVPYAPPLAAGEFVSVVRTELEPTALARMGIPVDLSDTDDIAADVMVGEDGFPRAVRVVETAEF